MMHFVRDFRLIPVVLVATGCLLALKVLGLILGGSYTLGELSISDQMPAARSQAPASPPRADAIAAFRSVWSKRPAADPSDAEITGSVGAASAPKPEAPKEPATADVAPGGKLIALDKPAAPSIAERALLERLQERRQEIEARAREIEIRENLLKSAEERLQTRSGEMKGFENQANAATQKKDEAEAARFKSIVSMYENMKAKDAAKIFDRLDIKILVDIASQLNPRRMSDIMAQMQPDNAERLTVELAGRSSVPDKPAVNELPKIEARPNGG
jgi:flagellar motility protein MotE (MotC chaperone)